MRIILIFLLAVALLGLGIQDAEAGRRSIRIDFDAWSDEFAIGSGDCPGSSAASDTIVWNGISFIGSSFSLYNVYEYCQTIATYEEFLGADEYLNEDIFFDDETGLAAKIGANQDEPFITAIRYTFLNGGPFEEDTEGFQWAFYFFPNGVTLVTIYGEIPIDPDKFDPWITDGDKIFWDALESGYDGEYFCFDNGEYAGLWDGSNVGTDPIAGCVPPPKPENIFTDGFEIPDSE